MNMIRFTIYTYLFKPINEPQEPDMFSPEVKVEESLARKQELLGEMFLADSKLRFSRSRADGEGKQFEHLVVAQREGIIVMRLANSTQQVHEKDFNRWTEEDNPSLYVLIDNRKDKQIIAIENRPQAFSETATVAHIMEETFNRRLWSKRLQVQINAKYRTREFWDVVSEYEQGIASVTFKFPYPNLPEISDMVGEYYTELARRTNTEPKTTITAPPKEKAILQQGDLILEQMIKAASASGKVIMMRPKGARKWRKIGLETIVQEELSDQALKGLEQQEIIAHKWQAIVDFLDRILTVYA
jgi:hypothetical protein